MPEVVPYYTIAEALEVLGFRSRSSIYYRIEEGSLEVVLTAGGSRLLTQESVDSLRGDHQ